eukprot:scaffold5437_cov105-Pinguiococcus_pyrenoidosus.AAC.1
MLSLPQSVGTEFLEAEGKTSSDEKQKLAGGRRRTRQQPRRTWKSGIKGAKAANACVRKL